MGRRADIIAGLGGRLPALRRYARALCAGRARVADDLVQSALQSVGARIRAKELRPADLAEARIEAYAALVSLAQRKLANAPRPAPRHPPIVHGLADLAFERARHAACSSRSKASAMTPQRALSARRARPR